MASRAARLFARLRSLVPAGVSGRAVLGYGLWFLVLFLLFLVVTFPHEVLARRLTADLATRSGWTVEFDSLKIRLFEGYRFTNVRAHRAGSPGGALALERLSLRPRWTDFLFHRHTTLVASGEAYGGEFSAEIGGRAEGPIEIEIENVDLATVATLRSFVEGDWAGKLSGHLRLENLRDVATLSGGGAFQLADASLTRANASGFSIPELRFSRGDTEFAIEGGRIDFQRGSFAGPDLEAEVRGQVNLRRPADRSVLNLKIMLHPVPGAKSSLEPLLMLWNKNQRAADGRYNIGVGGTVGAPRLR